MIYQTFENLIEEINKISEHKIMLQPNGAGRHLGIRLVSNHFPISINESEFNFMRDCIIKYNLKTGVELSTGVGISTLSLLEGFSRTVGHLITLDSYYEEIYSISSNIPILNYTNENINDVKNFSNAYKLINDIINYKKYNNFVNVEIGWSPHDLIRLIKHRDKKVDFIFLDCPKSDEEFNRDLTALIPFLDTKYMIFVHDTHTFTEKSNTLVNELLNTNIQYIREYYKNTDHYKNWYFPLGLITNIEL